VPEVSSPTHNFLPSRDLSFQFHLAKVEIQSLCLSAGPIPDPAPSTGPSGPSSTLLTTDSWSSLVVFQLVPNCCWHGDAMAMVMVMVMVTATRRHLNIIPG